MKNTVLYTIYEYDTKLFIAMLCENKDRPELKCDGKCYLEKMLIENDTNDASNTIIHLVAEILYYNTATPIFSLPTLDQVVVVSLQQNTYYNNLYSFLYCEHRAKPPELA